MSDNIRGGIQKNYLESLKKFSKKAYDDFFKDINNKSIGFFDLPITIEHEKAKIRNFCAINSTKFNNFVHVGIGGSCLGPQAMFSALSNKYHNLVNQNKKIFFLDNIDSKSFENLLSFIDLKSTLFNIVSKSGTTIETITQFLLIKERLLGLGKSYLKNIVITTDPEKGPLREFANKFNLTSFTVPQNVGGRYSLFSSVGLFPMCFLGIDIEEFIRGAKDYREEFLSFDIFKNKAILLSLLLYVAYKKYKKNILVFFTYSDFLFKLGDWFNQLWAESLGKLHDRGGNVVNTGQTPMVCIGSRDQHSLVQLFMEGPLDKIIMFLEIEKQDINSKIKVDTDFKAFNYLIDKNLFDLMRAERLATSFALKNANQANLTIKIPEINPYNMGYLTFLFEVACAFSGFLHNIDPYNQPGVELGKLFTKHFMGCKMNDKHKKELIKLEKKIKRHII
jgi:glucose-6-phosphate isomerase